MLTARFVSTDGQVGDARELPGDPFDGRVHDVALYQVIKAQLANRRQGTAATKTRAEVAGGNRKPYRQKGTGRARQGSIRAPQFRGGGIVFGPQPRSYNQRIPKKLNALARRSAFNTRALADQVAIFEGFTPEVARTREIRDLLQGIGFSGRRVLILTNGHRPEVYRSARNLPGVTVKPYREASAYELLLAKALLIEEGALAGNQLVPVAASGTQEVTDA